jgi:hypothetical protein
MGRILREDDIYIGSLLDLLNLRFGPSQGPRDSEWFGGIDELVELQREFQIFRANRRLKDCLAILNLGGFWNARTKNRWFTFIDDLSAYGSDTAENGHDRILNELIRNFEHDKPLPVYFKAHDHEIERRVLVTQEETSVFYIKAPHIIVSMPMIPKEAPAPRQR